MFKYKEISHLSKQEQKAILEKAKHATFHELKLGPRAVVYFSLSLLLGAAVMFISSQLMNSYVSGGFAALAMFTAYQVSNGSLIGKGLKHVLEKNS